MNRTGNLLTQLVALVRGGKNAPEPPPAVTRQRVPDEELRERAERGRLLLGLLDDPAFKEYRRMVLSLADREKSALVDLTDEALTGYEGVGKKHFIRGMVFALAQVAVAVKAGVDAEKELSARATPKQELTQVTRVG